MFALHSKSPALAPIPPPCTSHLPLPFLSAIAASLAVPLNHLCTFTIRSGTPLFEAVNTCASHYPRPATLRQPLRWIIDEDSARPSESYDCDEGDEEEPCAEPPSPPMQPPKKKQKTDHFDGLNFSFELGETLILWPPEPHLAADAIIETREKEGIARLEQEAARPAILYDESKHTVIHLTRYEITSFEGRSEYFHVATAAGQLSLKKFAYEVLRWAEDQRPVSPNTGTFGLLQFVAHHNGHYGNWENKGRRFCRDTQSVILSNGCMHEILHDVRHFLEPCTKAWFSKHGLPYKRNYLFFGTPGTGKTSTIRVIAGVFGLKCAFLSTTDSNFSNQLLFEALTTLPRKSILIIEDVDSMFNKNRENEANNSLSYSGLLNALDGITSMEGVITIMTTNHFERLDQALIRGGRVDKRVFFPPPSHEQIELLFKRFYPEASDLQTRTFSKRVFAHPEGKEAQSIATLQQFFVRNREKSAEECLEALEEFYTVYFTEKHMLSTAEKNDSSDAP